jgi:hypothetical protein
MTWKRRLVVVTIVSLGVTAAIAIGVLLLGDFGETEGRILATTLALSVCGLLSLPAAVLLEQDRARLLAWVTGGLAATSFAAFEVAIWNDDNEKAWKTVGTLAALAVASTQVSGLTSRLRAGDRRAVRVVYACAVGIVLVLAAMVVAAIWAEIESDTYYRVLAALAVLNVFLIVVQPLLRRLGTEPSVMFRVRLTTEPGDMEELELTGRDFADAVAVAIRTLERRGRRVTSLERL